MHEFVKWLLKCIDYSQLFQSSMNVVDERYLLNIEEYKIQMLIRECSQVVLLTVGWLELGLLKLISWIVGLTVLNEIEH